MVFNIKYDHLGSQNNNLFYHFYNQLDHILAHDFAKSENTKGYVDKFLSYSLIVSQTNKLFYQNADEWIEKLLEIPWGILNDKYIRYKFKLESSVTAIARQEIAIYLRNMAGCLKFLIKHPGFWHNQTFEPSRIYNENEEQVYIKMHTDK